MTSRAARLTQRLEEVRQHIVGCSTLDEICNTVIADYAAQAAKIRSTRLNAQLDGLTARKEEIAVMAEPVPTDGSDCVDSSEVRVDDEVLAEVIAVLDQLTNPLIDIKSKHDLIWTLFFNRKYKQDLIAKPKNDIDVVETACKRLKTESSSTSAGPGTCDSSNS